jgi:hypothetical protein
MSVKVLCFGGASSSCGDNPLGDVVMDVTKGLMNVMVISLPIASARRLRRKFDRLTKCSRPVVCVGKSLGAVRMFRVLNSGRRWERVSRVVSIDPTDALRMIFGHDIRGGRVSRITTNYYQSDSSPQGQTVNGAANIRVMGTDHMGIMHSLTVRAGIRTAIWEADDRYRVWAKEVAGVRNVYPYSERR